MKRPVGTVRVEVPNVESNHSRRSIKWHEMELFGLSFISLDSGKRIHVRYLMFGCASRDEM